MKQFQVMLKDQFGIRALVNNTTIDASYFANNDICTKDSGYNTLGAAKRIATIATKKLILGNDVEISAVSTDELIAENVKYEAEQAAAAERAAAEAAVGGPLTDAEWAAAQSASKADNKAFTKALMQKHYPQREAEIRTEHGEANSEITESSEIKPAKANPVRKPRPRKSPLGITEKQTFFLDNMRKDSFYEHGIDSILFVDVLADTLEGLGMGKMTTGAMVSTLREKGIIVTGKDSRGAGKFTTMALTDLGKEVMRKYNLA